MTAHPHESLRGAIGRTLFPGCCASVDQGHSSDGSLTPEVLALDAEAGTGPRKDSGKAQTPHPGTAAPTSRADRGALLAGLAVSTQGGKVLLADGVRGSATLTLAEAGLARNSVLSVSGKLLGGMLAAQMALQRERKRGEKKKAAQANKASSPKAGGEGRRKSQRCKSNNFMDKVRQIAGDPKEKAFLEDEDAKAQAAALAAKEAKANAPPVSPSAVKTRSGTASAFMSLVAAAREQREREEEEERQARSGDNGGLAYWGAWAKYRYLQAGYWLAQNVANQGWFEGFIMLCIVLVGLSTGAALNGYDGPTATAFIDLVGWVTFVVFLLEVGVKLVACGPRPLRYFTAPHGDGGFNCIDFGLATASVALLGSSSAGTVKALRLVRLVRVLTLPKNVPALKVIIVGLLSGLNSVAYIVSILLLVIYIYGIAGVLLFGQNDPAHFGSVSVAMLTLFQVTTLTSWGNLAWIEWYGCDVFGAGLYAPAGDDDDADEVDAATVATLTGPLPKFVCGRGRGSPFFASLYFATFTLVAAMVVMSLFIGVITMGMFDAFEEMNSKRASASYKAGVKDIHEALFPKRGGRAQSELSRKVDFALSKLSERKRRKWHRSQSSLAASLRQSVRHVLLLRQDSGLHFRRTFKKLWRAADSSSLSKEAIGSPAFVWTTTSCIVVSGVVIGLSTDGVGHAPTLWGLELACLAVFTLECALKLAAAKYSPRAYLEDPWNAFDTLIVVNGWLEETGFAFDGLAVLRLLRVLKVLRLVKALPRLRSIVESLVTGFGSVGWVLLLMALFNYIASCVGVLLFSHLAPFHYGSIQQGLFTTYQVETLDSYDQVLKVAMYGCGSYPGGPVVDPLKLPALVCPEDQRGLGWVAAAYFVAVTLFGGLILPTMLIGIVTVSFEEAFRHSETDRKNQLAAIHLVEKVRADMPSFFTEMRVALLKDVFRCIDADDSGTLDLNEVTPLVRYMATMCLRVQLSHDEAVDFVTFFDEDSSADIHFGELLLIIRYVVRAKQSGRLQLLPSRVRSRNRDPFARAASGKDVFLVATSSKRAMLEGVSGRFEHSENHEDFSWSATRKAGQKTVALAKAAEVDGLGHLFGDGDSDDEADDSGDDDSDDSDSDGGDGGDDGSGGQGGRGGRGGSGLGRDLWSKARGFLLGRDEHGQRRATQAGAVAAKARWGRLRRRLRNGGPRAFEGPARAQARAQAQAAAQARWARLRRFVREGGATQATAAAAGGGGGEREREKDRDRGGAAVGRAESLPCPEEAAAAAAAPLLPQGRRGHSGGSGGWLAPSPTKGETEPAAALEGAVHEWMEEGARGGGPSSTHSSASRTGVPAPAARSSGVAPPSSSVAGATGAGEDRGGDVPSLKRTIAELEGALKERARDIEEALRRGSGPAIAANIGGSGDEEGEGRGAVQGAAGLAAGAPQAVVSWDPMTPNDRSKSEDVDI